MTPAHPRGADPRIAARETDIRPVVAAPTRRVPLWIVVGGIGVAAMLLFLMLDSRRRALTAPATRSRISDAYDRAGNPPATLFVPPVPASTRPFASPPMPVPRVAPVPAPAIVPRAIVPQLSDPISPQIGLSSPLQPAPGFQPEAPRRGGGGGGGGDTVLVFDATQGDAGSVGAAAPAANASGAGAGTNIRVGTSAIRNRSTTVPQGTLIPAVLETALDSTRPGLARALVQSDVRGFDGTQVLIARGSRLIGEYQADLRAGQNRAGVMWTRLVRPDGVTIALESPATDTLGRGGIRGKVNSHFFERFGSAILQSALDVGVNLASRLGNNNTSVVVGYPLTQGASATQGLITGGSQVQRTLTVRQGTALMIFVARDLEFAGAAGR